MMADDIHTLTGNSQILVFLLLLAGVLIYRELREIRLAATRLLEMEAQRDKFRERDAALWRKQNPWLMR